MDIKGKIEEASKTIPVPAAPRDATLKKFTKLMSQDLEDLPDIGPGSLGRLLETATAVCAHSSYQVGYWKAMWISTKSKDDKAMLAFWEGIDRAYEKYMNGISRQISLRRDAWERERGR